MGRPRKVSTTIEQEPDDPSAPSDQTADELAEIADEGHRATQARISRLGVDNNYAHLDSVQASAVDENWIRNTYGGGTYRVQLFGQRKDNTWGYLKGPAKLFRIHESIPFKGPLLGRKDGDAPPEIRNADGTRAGGDDSDMRFMLKTQMIEMMKDQTESRNATSMMMMNMMKMMSESSSAMMQAMTAIMQAAKSQPGDSGVKELLAPLLAALVNKKDPTEIAAQLMTLMKSGNAPGLSELGGLDGLLDLADRLNKRANGDEEITMTGIIKDSLPKALDLFSQFAAQRANAPTAVEAPRPRAAISAGVEVAPAAPASSPAQPAQPAMPADEWSAAEPYIPHLVGFAQNDADPHGVAMTVLTLAPGPLKALIRDLVSRDTAAQEFVTRFPALVPYKVWTAQLLEEFHAELFGDGDDAGDTPPDGEPAPGAENADESPVG